MIVPGVSLARIEGAPAAAGASRTLLRDRIAEAFTPS